MSSKALHQLRYLQDSARINTDVKMKRCWHRRTIYPGPFFPSLAESSFAKEASVLFDLDHKRVWRRFSWTLLETAAYARNEAFCKQKVKPTSQVYTKWNQQITIHDRLPLRIQKHNQAAHISKFWTTAFRNY